jgi:cell division protease FtsH
VRKRGSGFGGGNDEREQTLNQILTEMDGFEQNQKVIVMAATNRSDVLDPALLRPGRFDRRVMVDLPDRRDREEILKIHSRKKPLETDIDLKVVAERTPGFSGADLASLMNEAAIRAARADRKKVIQEDVVSSIEKVLIGPERKSHLLSPKEKKKTAYHEAGHALVASVLPDADPVHKVTIVSRGQAGGFTMKLPLEEKKLHTRKEFLDDIAMSLGGYVAEKMIFGETSTGPASDLQVATRLARSMVTKWGMSDVIGPIALEGHDSEVMYGRGFGEKEYSDQMNMTIDSEVKKIIDDSLKVAEKVLSEKREVLDAIANALVEKETLEQKEYNELIKKFGIEPKVLPDTKKTGDPKPELTDVEKKDLKK